MQLGRAQVIAGEVIEKLKPHCERIEVAGSIRRRRPFVHDIDIVALPSNQGQFITALYKMGPLKMGGQKLIRVELNSLPDSCGVILDFYIATPETWATLLLIRTGSKEHNIKLCKIALQKGMKLHADGSGLFKNERAEVSTFERRIAGDTEESIFTALGLKYLRPEERN